jgi:hypothetical protein
VEGKVLKGGGSREEAEDGGRGDVVTEVKSLELLVSRENSVVEKNGNGVVAASRSGRRRAISELGRIDDDS